jgi:hypothetical protein
MKLVVNKCYGGFSLSLLAQQEYLKCQGKEAYFYEQVEYNFRTGKDLFKRVTLEKIEGNRNLFCYTIMKDLGETTTELDTDFFFSSRDIPRNDPDLVTVVEELGEKADGGCAELRIIEIPDDVNWQIEEYDGMEHIAEVHRTW